MEGLLKQTQGAVNAADLSKPLSPDLSRLAKSLDQTASTSVSLPSSVSYLLQEILVRIVELLNIPYELGQERNEDDEEDLESITAAEQLSKSFINLSTPLLELSISLVALLSTPSDPPQSAELSIRSDLFLAFSKFQQPSFSSQFTNSTLKSLSSNLLTLLLAPPHVRFPLLHHLLSRSFPSHFSPHPYLNPQTGRLLNRPLGGARGKDEWSESAEEGWKREVGLNGTVLSVIRELKREEMEEVWHLVLPPLLSYLDDFTVKNKILGLSLLDTLLDRVEGGLLRRTGVGKVFEQSLNVIFSNLSDPLSPLLLSSAHPVALKLLRLVNPPPAPTTSITKDLQSRSKAHFEATCRLFETSIIKTWEFKSGNLTFELLTLDALLSGLIKEMMIESTIIRYFSLLVPHLTSLISPPQGELPWTEETIELRGKAVKCFRMIGEGENERRRLRARWEDLLVSSIGKCWVGLEEDREVERMRQEGEKIGELESELKGLVKLLTRGGKERKEGERDFWKELRELDPMFEELFEVAGGDYLLDKDASCVDR
ncbi:hypothetical protein JCM5353_008536 [Sporobolomyces roseus]